MDCRIRGEIALKGYWGMRRDSSGSGAFDGLEGRRRDGL